MGFDPASIAFAVMAASSLQGAAATAIFNLTFFAVQAVPVALSIGASAYQAQQQRKALAAANDGNAIKSILKQAIPPQRLVLGEALTGGPLFFYEAKPPYIWMGVLLASHECEGLQSIRVNGQDVFFGPDRFATSAPFRDGSNIYLEASFRPGTLGQVIDPIIARDFPTMPATFRQRGHATVVIKAHYGFGATREAEDDDHKRVYGDSGRFQPLFRLRGAKVHDPRAAGQSLDDATTWTWSDNFALCLGRYLTYAWPDQMVCDPARLDWAKFAEAADDSDVWESAASGAAFRRHTVNGVIQSVEGPFDVIENMKIAGSAHVVMDRGKIFPVCRKRREPQATLHAGILRGAVEYITEPRQRDLANIVKTTFVAPNREWEEVGGPVLRRTDLIAEDGGAREMSLRGAYVETHERMQRKAATALKVARRQRFLACGATLEALDWEIGKPIRVDLPGVMERMNGVFELIEKAWDERLLGFRLTLAEDVPDAVDFNVTDEKPFVLDDATLEAEAA